VTERCDSERKRVGIIHCVLIVVTVGIIVAVFVLSYLGDLCLGKFPFEISLLSLTFVFGIAMCSTQYVRLRPLQVDTQNSQCAREEDTDMITAIVMKHGGFHKLDERIYRQRMIALRGAITPLCGLYCFQLPHWIMRCGDLMFGAPSTRYSQVASLIAWTVIIAAAVFMIYCFGVDIGYISTEFHNQFGEQC